VTYAFIAFETTPTLFIRGPNKQVTIIGSAAKFHRLVVRKRQYRGCFVRSGSAAARWVKAAT